MDFPLTIGLYGPALLGGRVGGKRLPAVALITDSAGDWSMVDGGATVPDGYAVVDADNDIAADTVVTSGLTIGFDTDGDPYADVP